MPVNADQKLQVILESARVAAEARDKAIAELRAMPVRMDTMFRASQLQSIACIGNGIYAHVGKGRRHAR